MEHNPPTMRAWIVGQNETAILGEGWYGRCPEWYGLPYRESFGSCSLRLPETPAGGRITLVVGAPLCRYRPMQKLLVRCGDRDWVHELIPQPEGYGWQRIVIPLEGSTPVDGPLELRLEPEVWRHGDYEEVQDFREVGILLGAVILDE